MEPAWFSARGGGARYDNDPTVLGSNAMQRGEEWRNDDRYRTSRVGSRRDLDEGWERESWRGGLRGTRREPYEGRFDRGPNEMMSRPEEAESREARGYGGGYGEHEGYGPYGRHPASSYRDEFGGSGYERGHEGRGSTYREGDFGRGLEYERSAGARYGRGFWNPEPQFERESGYYYGDTGRRPAEGSRQGYRYLGEGTFRAGSGGMEGERWDRSGSEWSGRSQSDYGRTGQRSTTGTTRARRGPKGYTRSDERIREDVCDRLSDSDLNCDEVEVNVKNGEVILTGTTDSGDTRREIERVTETVSGVKDVTNQIRMRREASSSSSTGDGRKSNQGSNSEGSSTRRENAKSV